MFHSIRQYSIRKLYVFFYQTIVAITEFLKLMFEVTFEMYLLYGETALGLPHSEGRRPVYAQESEWLC